MKSLLTFVAFTAVLSSGAIIETSYPCPDFMMPGSAKMVSGAEVKSFNTITRKVMVKYGSQIKIIPLEAMPQEIQLKFSKIPIPPPTNAEIVASQKEDAAFRKARENNMIHRETQVGQDALNEERKSREESRRLAVKKQEMEMEEQILLKRHIAEMANYARSRFNGDNVIILGSPEEVPGWPGQWRVRGEYDAPTLTNGRVTGYRKRDWSMIIGVNSGGLQTISVER